MADSVYPGGVKQWTDKVDFVDDVSANHINEAYAEIIAIETDLVSSTPDATANKVIRRDTSGRAKVAAPSALTDIARKQEVDTAESNAKSYTDTHESKSASTSAKGHIQLSTSISSTSTTLAATPSAVKSVNDSLNAHKEDYMPHQFVDGDKTYRWGFRTLDGQPQFIYEEVI